MKSQDDLTERDAFRNHGLANEEEGNTDKSESDSESDFNGYYDAYEEYLRPPPVQITTVNTIVIKAPPILQQTNKTPNLLNTRKGIGKNDILDIRTNVYNIDLHNPYNVLRRVLIRENSEILLQQKEIEEGNDDSDAKKTKSIIPVNKKNTGGASTTGLKMWFSKFITSELCSELCIGVAFVLVHWYIHSKLKKN